VMETALKTAPGRCLLNSVNLEAGRPKAEKLFTLARKYNAAVIALTIDEQGMAKTAARKVEVARRIHDMAVNEFGLRPQDLVFDALTYTLATGDSEYADSALETLEGIRQIKAALTGVLTSLGVSNVSFGLTPSTRAVLNSVMLYHAVEAGLDMAIVNPAQITAYNDISAEERQMADDLILNRDPQALVNLIERYQKTSGNEAKKAVHNPTEGMTTAQKVHWRILHRHKDGIEADLDELLAGLPADQKSGRAVEVLNQVLLPAMKEVGDKFGSGELILPFVLQSAEVMKRAVSHLENFLEKKDGSSKGTLVLATVYGDVHDIGKNLVKTILSNNGYRVVDLGKQVPAETIITQAVQENASAIGLSALLVSTSKQMPLIINELHRRKLNFPVLVGGAAINPRFGRRILQTDSGDLYEPGVFYCKDAFEGLAVMENLGDSNKRSELLERIRREAAVELGRIPAGPAPAHSAGESSTPRADFIPQPSAYGSRVVKMPLEAVFSHLAKKELFRLSWGAKNAQNERWEKLQAQFEKRLLVMQKEAQVEGWLDPRGVYGYWPAQSSGDELIVYRPESIIPTPAVEIARFHFPRQPNGDRLCLADYFAPVESGTMDVVALQVVTVGQEATRRVHKLQDAGDYSEAYFTHGLGVQTAEAAAEYLHRHIRRELGLQPEQGKRYSWGYPAIPELADHAKVFQLLPVETELGMQLTSAYQLIPEQSTAAIIIHHPAARYYSVGETRLEQLMR
ncbi:methionine synthase, partial [bacterium]